jgi:hypothetical protein
MGVSAKYALNIKDITYVSGPVEMTVQLSEYVATSYQDTAVVENKLLSEITIPGYFDSNIGSITVSAGGIAYIPFAGDAFLKTAATFSDGYQYAVASMFANCNQYDPSIVAAHAPTLGASCQFSNNGNDWYTASHQAVIVCNWLMPSGPGSESTWNPLSAQFLIPGNVDPVAVWIRWKLYNTSDVVIAVSGYTVSLDVVPRHQHVWSQTGQPDNTMQAVQVDDASLVGSTPQTITCIINGGAPFAIACAAPSFSNNVDIKSSLVTGNNIIEFTSTTKCSVTPSATYLALPT